MISDATLRRIYQSMGCERGPIENGGRRRKIKEALEEAWPAIRKDVLREIETKLIEEPSWMEK